MGNDDRQTGTGETASEMLDYVLDLNKDENSELFGKIDEAHIGCIGYSQGGAGALPLRKACGGRKEAFGAWL